jgi:hypothetical protein
MTDSVFCWIDVDVADIINLSENAIGQRRMVPITGGRVHGEIGDGLVLPGTDWQWIHADGTVSLDAHYALQLNSGELVEVESRGVRHISEDGSVYFRTSIRFTTSASRPDINQRLFLATGERRANQVRLAVTAVS